MSNEYFPTPLDLAALLAERMRWFSKGPWNNVLEPSAGTGAFCGPLSKIGGVVTAIDPNFDAPPDLPENVEWGRMSLEELHADLGGMPTFDMICGNPPFSLAEAHVKLGHSLLKPEACLGFLLRLAFLESAKRVPFFGAYRPRHVFVLPKRPTFMWAWHCKQETCKHDWFELPKTPQLACPKCEHLDIYKNTSDSAAYGFFIWQRGFMGETTLSHLGTAPGEESE